MLTSAEIVDARRFCGYSLGDLAIDPTLIGLGTDAETVVRAEIVQIRSLYTDLAGATTRLSTAKAAVWTRNASEVGDRQALLYGERLNLCNMLGVPPGPFMGEVGITAPGSGSTAGGSSTSFAPAAFVV